MSDQRLLEALAITSEICGATFTPAASRAVVLDLQAYPLPAVLAALQRCRRELGGRLTLAAIIERIDDGRPTPDEAWSQVGTLDEGRTLVSTEEAMEAMGQVRQLLKSDEVAARRAFLDCYRHIVTCNRASGIAVQPVISLGHDQAGRRGPIVEAVQRGRLSPEHAEQVLGEPIELPALQRPSAQLLELTAELAQARSLGT